MMMGRLLKALINKLGIVLILLAMCFTTNILHNKLVKEYEHSTIAKYNIFSETISMTQGVNRDSMKLLEHKIRVKVEAQKIFYDALRKVSRGSWDYVPYVEIYLTSGGGGVVAGFSVMNIMNKYQKEYGAKFLTVADGFCYSMCFAILQQGDERAATRYTVLGTHPASGGDRRLLRLMEALTSENVMEKSLYFSGRGFKVWKAFYMLDFYHDPKKALRYNLIDFKIL
jgi:ATP-dependent protease ClpP protease subunit